MRTATLASGGLEVNNTVTGSGYERALTTSDLGGRGFSDATVQTTDATQTTLQTITIPTDEERIITIRVRAHEDATDDSFWYVSTVGVKNVGGTVSLIGSESVQTGGDAGAAAWLVDINASGANALVQVTGEIAHTINWTTHTEVS
jgi:hypothetical protein